MTESEEFQLVAPVDPHVLVLEHIEWRIDELRTARTSLREARDTMADMQNLGADLGASLAMQDQRIKLIDDLINHFKESRTVLQRAQHPVYGIEPGHKA